MIHRQWNIQRQNKKRRVLERVRHCSNCRKRFALEDNPFCRGCLDDTERKETVDCAEYVTDSETITKSEGNESVQRDDWKNSETYLEQPKLREKAFSGCLINDSDVEDCEGGECWVGSDEIQNEEHQDDVLNENSSSSSSEMFVDLFNTWNCSFGGSDETQNEEQQNDVLDEDSSSSSSEMFVDPSDMWNYSFGENDTRNEVLWTCQNCYRKGPYIAFDDGMFGTQEGYELYKGLSFQSMQPNLVHYGRKFCLMKRADAMLQKEVRLCAHCCVVVAGEDGDNRRLSPEFCWPAYMWSMFVNAKIRKKNGIGLWRYVTMPWRSWWIDAVRHLPGLNLVTLVSPKPYFVEVSENKMLLEKAINDLLWLPLVKAVDSYGALPIVKCPWGCSDFLNCTKHVPLDAIFGHFVGADVRGGIWMCGKTQRQFLEGVRGDFPKSGHPILHNRQWMCRPSISYSKGKGPVVLTCFAHDTRSRGRYVHMPTNPTGTIMTPKSDQYCQAIMVPRTVSAAQAREFTDAFQLNEIYGSYEGVDSMYLSDRGRYNVTSPLSGQRDALSVAGRADVRHHLQRLVEEKAIPQWLADDKCLHAEELWPEEQLRKAEKKHSEGATFVAMEDAMAVEKSLKWNGGCTVWSAYSDDESECSEDSECSECSEDGECSDGSNRGALGRRNGLDGRHVHFTATWSNTILWAHPVNDYGARFPTLPNLSGKKLEGRDSRPLWSTVAMVAGIPKLWSTVVDAVSDTTLWHGWLLKYVTQKCFPMQSVRGSRNNPFRKVVAEHRLLDFFAPPVGEKYVYDPSFVVGKFNNLGKVYVVGSSILANHTWERDNELERNEEIDVVIVYQTCEDQASRGEFLVEQQNANNRLWELRCVVCTNVIGDSWHGSVYHRHGGMNFPAWWVQHRRDKGAQKFPKDVPGSVGTAWDIAVYVSARSRGSMLLTEEYLKMNGGQTLGRCSVHDLPLVTAAFRSHVKCGSCSKAVDYVCPHSGCCAGICKKHYEERALIDSTFFVDAPGRIVRCRRAEVMLMALVEEDSEYSQRHTFVEQASAEGNEQEDEDDAFPEVVCAGADGAFQWTADDANGDNRFSDESVQSLWEDDFVDPYMAVEVQDDLEEQLSEVNSLASFNDAVQGEVALEEPLPMNNVHETDHLEPDEGLYVANDSLSFPTTSMGQSEFALCRDRQYVGCHVVLNKHCRVLVRDNSPLKGARWQRNFLQRIIANGKETTVPLVYPEAVLFNSLFWRSRPDGSIDGALPSVLMTDGATLKRLGFATLPEHYRTRLMDTALLSSTDHRYQFLAFDACVNLGMRGQDTRMYLSRGFASWQGEGGLRLTSEDDYVPVFDTDSVDCRPVVNQLAAALGVDMATFFLTHTCSMKNHFGIRVVKQWLDSPEALEQIRKDIDPDGRMSYIDLQEVRKNLIQSSCGLALRCWINVTRIYMTYVIKSPEKPVGTVYRSWWRYELQEVMANVPHIHAILWLDEDDGTEEGTMRVASKIRASIATIVTAEESKKYIAEGLISSQDALVDMLLDYSRILLHKHNRRCLIPKKGKDGTFGASYRNTVKVIPLNGDKAVMKHMGNYRCKVPDNYLLSPNPTRQCFVDITVQHNDSAMKLLKAVGLVEVVSGRGGIEHYEPEVVYNDESLVMKRHFPPTSAAEGIISPVISDLAILNECSQNAQKVDGFGVSRYIAKYLGGIDEGNRVFVSAPKKNHPSHFRVHAEATGNTKIGSVRIEEAKKKAEDHERKHQRGRLVGQPEVYMKHLGIDQVYTDMEFVRVPTVPMDERVAFDRVPPVARLRKQGVVQGPISGVADLDASSVVPTHSVRSERQLRGLPNWRRYKDSTLLMAKNDIFCPLSMDGVTVFGLRPPELSFVRNQCLYLQCFERSNIVLSKEQKKKPFDSVMDFCIANIKVDYRKCLWIDATNKVVRLRAAGVNRLVDYIRDAPDELFDNRMEKNVVSNFFGNLQRELARSSEGTAFRRTTARRTRTDELWARYLCHKDKLHLPVVWFSNVKPIHASRFLYHILLSMGSFNNELDLLSCGTMERAYVHAGLLDPDPTNRQASVKALTKKYILEQLKNVPGGTPQFDRFAVSAYRVFESSLLHGRLASDGLPPYLYSRLQEKSTEKVEAHVTNAKTSLVKVVLNELNNAGLANLPTIEQLMSITPVDCSWSINDVARGSTQTEESFMEQQAALRMGADSVREYMDFGSDHCPKGVCIVGSPGTGKTTVNTMMLLHSMCKKLNCCVTAIMSERALQLGGRHAHWMIEIPVSDVYSVSHVADIAIANLYKNPAKLEFLRRLDVMVIDELGQWSCDLICAVDIILRKIRNCPMFFGGILVIATMDVLQLLPIKGKQAMLSPLVLSNFRFAELRHSVRASGDVPYTRMQDITRLLPHEFTAEREQEFQQLVMDSCTFVDSVDDPRIPPNAVFVYSKKDPCKDAVTSHVARIVNSKPYRIAVAQDQERTTEARNWSPASNVTVNFLNYHKKEPKELCLYERGLYELTYNKDNEFSQSQLAILLDLPPPEVVREHKPFEVLVAPPGCKENPDNDATREDLLEAGWTAHMVEEAPTRPARVHNRLKGVRKQYGLRLRIASTLHSAMGQTLGTVVSQVSEDSSSEFYLWERAQVVVLLSRTRRARDLIFVDRNPRRTARALSRILRQMTQYTKYICHLLSVMTRGNDQMPTVIEQYRHPFRPQDIPLPADNSGCCYLLISSKEAEVTYIGETQNLGERLQCHNSGYGSHQTHSLHLRPWAVLAYVTGFRGIKNRRKAFESQWKNLRNREQRHLGRRLHPWEIVELAGRVILSRKQDDPSEHLVLVKTGRLVVNGAVMMDA